MESKAGFFSWLKWWFQRFFWNVHPDPWKRWSISDGKNPPFSRKLGLLPMRIGLLSGSRKPSIQRPSALGVDISALDASAMQVEMEFHDYFESYMVKF